VKSERIKLITVITKTVPPGTTETVEEEARYAFCTCRSAGTMAFYSVRAEGMKADYIVTMYGFEYHGEELAEFRGKRYTVDRTAILVNGTKIDITLKDVVGIGARQVL